MLTDSKSRIEPPKSPVVCLSTIPSPSPQGSNLTRTPPPFFFPHHSPQRKSEEAHISPSPPGNRPDSRLPSSPAQPSRSTGRGVIFKQSFPHLHSPGGWGIGEGLLLTQILAISQIPDAPVILASYPRIRPGGNVSGASRKEARTEGEVKGVCFSGVSPRSYQLSRGIKYKYRFGGEGR